MVKHKLVRTRAINSSGNQSIRAKYQGNLIWLTGEANLLTLMLSKLPKPKIIRLWLLKNNTVDKASSILCRNWTKRCKSRTTNKYSMIMSRAWLMNSMTEKRRVGLKVDQSTLELCLEKISQKMWHKVKTRSLLEIEQWRVWLIRRINNLMRLFLCLELSHL